VSEKEFWWLLAGIALGFGLQVLYDSLGIFYGLRLKYWGGVLMVLILSIFLEIFWRTRLSRRGSNDGE
jgi:hypothetical protein